MKLETISALALKSDIYNQMFAAANSEETTIVIRNKIVTGRLDGFSSTRVKTKKLTLRFIGCVFKDPVNIDRVCHKHYVVINIASCVFLKSLDISLWKSSSVYIENTSIENKFYVCADTINLEQLSAEYCRISPTGKRTLLIGRISVRSLIFSGDRDSLKMMHVSCHISTLELISRMLPQVLISEVYADKGKRIPQLLES